MGFCSKSYDESSVVETRRWSAPGLNGSQSRVSCLGSSELCSGPANCVQFNYLNECYCAQRRSARGQPQCFNCLCYGAGSPGWSPPPRSIMTNAALMHTGSSVSIAVSVLENIKCKSKKMTTTKIQTVQNGQTTSRQSKDNRIGLENLTLKFSFNYV